MAKSDKLTVFGEDGWGSHTQDTEILCRILPTYIQRKIKFRVTESNDGLNVTYSLVTKELEPVKEHSFSKTRIKSSEYILTNDKYTEQAIRDFWYDENGKMLETDYKVILEEHGSEIEEDFSLIDKQYFFSTELGKDLTDITDPYGHLTWIVGDNDEDYQSNLIAFDYVVSECKGMIFLDSVFDNEKGHCLDRFEKHLVPIGKAIGCAKDMVCNAEEVLCECWSNYEIEHQDHNTFRELNLYTEGGVDFIKSITNEVNRIQVGTW